MEQPAHEKGADIHPVVAIVVDRGRRYFAGNGGVINAPLRRHRLQLQRPAGTIAVRTSNLTAPQWQDHCSKSAFIELSVVGNDCFYSLVCNADCVAVYLLPGAIQNISREVNRRPSFRRHTMRAPAIALDF